MQRGYSTRNEGSSSGLQRSRRMRETCLVGWTCPVCQPCVMRSMITSAQSRLASGWWKRALGNGNAGRPWNAAGEMAAQSERERIDIELRRRQQLGRLSQTILEREYDLQVVTAEQQIQQRDSWIARELSDLQRKKTELELELAKRDEQIQALRNEIDVLSAKSAVRELPAEVRGLVRLLTAAGTWKPESRSPRTLVPNASYGVDPAISLALCVGVGRCARPYT
jgi:hypothetical protein